MSLMSTPPDPLAGLPNNYFSDLEVPNVSIAVQSGTDIFTATTPGGSPHTLFQAASISKAVAALAVLALAEQRKLGLDDDVNARLKSWKLPVSPDWPVKVTVRNLLCHGGGVSVRSFPGYLQGKKPPTLIQILNGEAPSLTPAVRVTGLPGMSARYSGGGYTVLQQLIEDVSGKPFATAVTDLVFKPLTMFGAQYIAPEPESFAPGWLPAKPLIRPKAKPVPGGWLVYPELAAAGLWCTPTDLVKFAAGIQAMAAGLTRPKGQEFPLSQALATDMLTEQLADWSRGVKGDIWGLGVELDGSGAGRRFGHQGDNEGYSCEVTATVAPGPVIAIMTASHLGRKVIQPLLAEIRKRLTWPGAASIPTSPPPDPLPSSDELALLPKLYGGDYRAGSGLLLNLTGNGWNWTLTLPGQRPLPMEPKTLTWVVCPVLPIEIKFDVDPGTGRATGLTLRQIGDQAPLETRATRV